MLAYLTTLFRGDKDERWGEGKECSDTFACPRMLRWIFSVVYCPKQTGIMPVHPPLDLHAFAALTIEFT